MRQKEGSPQISGCKGCPAEYDPCLWSGAGDNPAHLVVIGNRPSGFSLGKNTPFFGPTGRLFRKLMDMVRKYQNGKYADVKIYKTYSVLAGEYEPSAEHVRFCQPNLMRELSAIRGIDGREPVIIAIGATPLKALGIPVGKITNVVGRVLTTTIQSPLGERKFNVVPVFEMTSVKKKPGLSNVVLAAMLQATKLALNEVEDEAAPLTSLTKDYVFPNTIEEVRDLVDYIIGYYDEERGRGPDQWVISLDTETNTLHPYMPDSKALMLSVAWNDGLASTILLDHPEVPYDPKKAWAEVKRLLACPKPKIFHNWKFDRKFLEDVYGCTVTRVVWDTMLGEHYLDEDKKGLYSLKKLTNIYAPAYVGYDDELQAILRGETTDDGVDILEVAEEDVQTMSKAPAGREQTMWDELIEVIAAKEREKAKPPKTRDRTIVTQSNARINQLYKMLDIKKPSQKKKKDDEDGGFEKIPLSTILQYAAIDADVTRIILKGQNQRLLSTDTLEEGRSVMNYLYLPGSRTLSAMEFRGVAVDFDHLDEVEQGVTEMLVKSEQDLRAKFDANTNYSSPAQVAKLMTKLNFERIDGANPGSTGKDVLDRYINHYEPGDHRREFAECLLEFRAAHKAKTGFIRKIRRLAARDGRIHCTMHLNGTATGRLSSANPNMQNIPPYMCRITRKDKDGKETVLHRGFNIKKIFIPSNPDNIMVNVDIKGAELRVYTAYSHDEKMIEALLQGLDVHSFTASKINKIPYEKVEAERYWDKSIKKMRDIAKRVVFGTFYGAGAYKIAEQIGGTKEEAQRVIDLLFEAFPALRQYIEGTKQQVRNRQFVKTHFGRFRRFRLAHANKELFAEACREAVNFLIQSTASDLVLSQLCEVSDNLPSMGGQMLLTVHDSMTFEMPKSMMDIQEVSVERGGQEKKILVDKKGLLHEFMDEWIVQRVKDKYDWLPVPFLYDVEAGPSYGEVKEIERWTG